MKLTIKLLFSLLVLFSVAFNLIQAQSNLQDLHFVKDFKITKDEIIIQLEGATSDYEVEIGGPGTFFDKQLFTSVNTIVLKKEGLSDKSFGDGQYIVQISPNFKFPKRETDIIRYLVERNDLEKAEELENDLRVALDMPAEVSRYTRSFRIMDGTFVLPETEDVGLKIVSKKKKWFNTSPAPRAMTVQLSKKLAGNDFDLPAFMSNALYPQPFDQVIVDDLIVDGSACVGQDCVNGESFGFDTIRIKENNLRIRAQDTSNSASFPTRDWQLTFNDSSNGGQNKFSVDDIDGGRTPFTIEASAPSHSLYVDDGGRIGFGTSTPVADNHIKSGNTPTARLEQDGSSGFTAQTWDVAGNEANFFIRDATNGSTLPFRIFPGAPSNALTIEGTTGDIGIGTTSPIATLHVLDDEQSKIQIESTEGFGGHIRFKNSNSEYQFGNTGAVAEGFLIYDLKNSQTMYSYEPLGGHQFLGGSMTIGSNGDGTTVTANSFPTFSDYRLKKDIKPLSNGLDKILKLTGYYYHWKKENHKNSSRQIGVVAQEVAEVLPEIVHMSKDSFYTVDYSKLTAVLIEAVKTQNKEIKAQREKIENLEEKIDRFNSLENQVAELVKLIQRSEKIENNGSQEVRK